jgi:hypothetical protein
MLPKARASGQQHARGVLSRKASLIRMLQWENSLQWTTYISCRIRGLRDFLWLFPEPNGTFD